MSISVEVWGDYALFTRPELKVERVSYDVITPSAARGLLDSIFFHPGMKWVVDSIHVCSPIRFTNIRRNEVKEIINFKKMNALMESGKGELCMFVNDVRPKKGIGLGGYGSGFSEGGRSPTGVRKTVRPPVLAASGSVISSPRQTLGSC